MEEAGKLEPFAGDAQVIIGSKLETITGGGLVTYTTLV